jgi:hypothetical protein
MQQYDVRLKSILHKAMPRLFRLLGLPPVAEYLTVEFPLRQKAVSDSVMRLTDRRILQIELQSKNDPRMLWRCLEYWQAIGELWPDADIVQVVIYLGDGPMTMVSSIARGRLTYGFDVLDIQEVEANAFLESESDDERVLAVLCHSEDPRGTIAAILASWKDLPAKEISEKIGDLFVLSQLRKRSTMVKEESDAMPIEIDVTENELFKWGEEVGEARGISLGESRGEAKLLTKFLERRFGPLPESVRTRIYAADVDTIDQWADRLELAGSLEAIFSDSALGR